MIEERVKDIEDRPVNVTNVIPMPHTDILGFGQWLFNTGYMIGAKHRSYIRKIPINNYSLYGLRK